MCAIPINLAIEDELSEAVARHLLEHANRQYAIGAAYGQTGFGYLRNTIRGWNRAARGIPFMVLTDLDRYPCPAALIQDWLAEPLSPNLLLRVAVREVEAWLLADNTNLAQFLNVPERRLPKDPDTLTDAKATLIHLAGESRTRDVRVRIAPRIGSTAKQGREYNASLSEFVRSSWDVAAAQARSPSLNRAVQRLATFTPIW
jgi:hypothetical protein